MEGSVIAIGLVPTSPLATQPLAISGMAPRLGHSVKLADCLLLALSLYLIASA
jgi:hypothetical protein